MLGVMPADPPARLSLTALKERTREAACRAVIHCQVAKLTAKLTKGGKPYLEAVLADAGDQILLRVWSDHPEFETVSGAGQGAFFEVTGDFEQSEFGIEAKAWSLNPLDRGAIDALLAGDDALRRRQEADHAAIGSLVESLGDPRLRAVATRFLEKFGARFRRTAAARFHHHARRGGLVEHTARMMRAADALCGVYPELNRDLLLVGCLVHDSGKLFENCLDKDSFAMPHTPVGELLGHIPAGIEMVNSLWHEAVGSGPDATDAEPPADLARLHLLHLIASHHGEHAFGSPTLPKTPEAMALHHIDNLDAKLEMMTAGLRTAPELAPGIHERVRPLPGNLVAPLPPYNAPGD